jgi:hypothetical protein
MSIEGRIAIDVNFADSSDTTGVQSLKKISLVGTTSYSSGTVAVVTGTVGTAAQSIVVTSYRNADGQDVTFSTVERVALQSSGVEVRYLLSSSPEVIGLVSRGPVAVGDIPVSFPSLASHRLRTPTGSGTATYTLVLYGT